MSLLFVFPEDIVGQLLIWLNLDGLAKLDTAVSNKAGRNNFLRTITEKHTARTDLISAPHTQPVLLTAI